MIEALLIRHALERCVDKQLGGNLRGAGTSLPERETDFSFDYKGNVYSVHIKRLKRRAINGITQS